MPSLVAVFKPITLFAVFTAVACTGDKGDPGPAGPPGPPGAAGSAPIAGLGGARTIAFAPVEFPESDAQKRAVLSTKNLRVDGKDYPVTFKTLFRSGDVKGKKWGLIVDRDGAPVLNEDGSEFVSSDTDFSSILTVGSKLFGVTHFESRPGGMYLTELAQDAAGALTPLSTKPIDFAPVGGLWVPCAGSVTPWGTHLGSEEYPADARPFLAATATAALDPYMLPMMRYFKLDPYKDADLDGKPDLTIEAIKAVFDPYAYGYPVEVTVKEDGTASVAKHYAMGRRALELAYVMPDKKTVYLTDDGTNVGFYLFIADTAGDLSAGQLHAMRWHQTSAVGGGRADIEWIDLGHATDAEVKALLTAKTTFADIFETADPAADNTCPAGFVAINTEPGLECLKLKAGKELAASRLESRRYAAYLGGTTELRKEEGMTFDPDSMSLFVAMSEVEKGMEDAHPVQDKGGPNHIRLEKNLCGIVYRLPVGPDARLKSDYVARGWQALLAGAPVTYPMSSVYAQGANTCSVNGIANPDNLSVMTGYGTLLVGEDSGTGHQNDVLWAYDLHSGLLTRLLTTPYGAETTSVYFYPDVKGFGYIKAVVQHPYGESDMDKTSKTDDSRRAYDGYLGPLPKLQ
jgi:secreted PhoX family phosphatase